MFTLLSPAGLLIYCHSARDSLLSDAISFKMDDEGAMAEVVSSEKNATLAKYEKVVDADLIEQSFTCDTNAKKRFFVDDTEQQDITKLSKVGGQFNDRLFRFSGSFPVVKFFVFTFCD